jgi:hypothetical protein
MRKPHEVLCSTKLHRKFGVWAAVEDTKAPDEESNAGIRPAFATANYNHIGLLMSFRN